jgi:hypothetical protein
MSGARGDGMSDLRLWEVTVDRWSTYIVAALDQHEAKRLALAEHNKGVPVAALALAADTIDDITPTRPAVIHAWQR